MVRVTGRRPRPRTLVAVALGIVGIDDGSVRRALLATTRRRYCPGKPMPDLFGPGHAALVCLRVLQAFAIGIQQAVAGLDSRSFHSFIRNARAE